MGISKPLQEAVISTPRRVLRDISNGASQGRISTSIAEMHPLNFRTPSSQFNERRVSRQHGDLSSIRPRSPPLVVSAVAAGSFHHHNHDWPDDDCYTLSQDFNPSQGGLPEPRRGYLAQPSSPDSPWIPHTDCVKQVKWFSPATRTAGQKNSHPPTSSQLSNPTQAELNDFHSEHPIRIKGLDNGYSDLLSLYKPMILSHTLRHDVVTGLDYLKGRPPVEHLDVCTVWNRLSLENAEILCEMHEVFVNALEEILAVQLETLDAELRMDSLPFQGNSDGDMNDVRPVEFNLGHLIQSMMNAMQIQYHRHIMSKSPEYIMELIILFLISRDCLEGIADPHNENDVVIFVRLTPGFDLFSSIVPSPIAHVIPRLDFLTFSGMDCLPREGSVICVVPEYRRGTLVKQNDKYTKITYTIEPPIAWLKWDAQVCGFKGRVPMCSEINSGNIGDVAKLGREGPYAVVDHIRIEIKALLTEFHSSSPVCMKRTVRARLTLKIIPWYADKAFQKSAGQPLARYQAKLPPNALRGGKKYDYPQHLIQGYGALNASSAHVKYDLPNPDQCISQSHAGQQTRCTSDCFPLAPQSSLEQLLEADLQFMETGSDLRVYHFHGTDIQWSPNDSFLQEPEHPGRQLEETNSFRSGDGAVLHNSWMARSRFPSRSRSRSPQRENFRGDNSMSRGSLRSRRSSRFDFSSSHCHLSGTIRPNEYHVRDGVSQCSENRTIKNDDDQSQAFDHGELHWQDNDAFENDFSYQHELRHRGSLHAASPELSRLAEELHDLVQPHHPGMNVVKAGNLNAETLRSSRTSSRLTLNNQRIEIEGDDPWFQGISPLHVFSAAVGPQTNNYSPQSPLLSENGDAISMVPRTESQNVFPQRPRGRTRDDSSVPRFQVPDKKPLAGSKRKADSGCYMTDDEEHGDNLNEPTTNHAPLYDPSSMSAPTRLSYHNWQTRRIKHQSVGHGGGETSLENDSDKSDTQECQDQCHEEMTKHSLYDRYIALELGHSERLTETESNRASSSPNETNGHYYSKTNDETPLLYAEVLDDGETSTADSDSIDIRVQNDIDPAIRREQAILWQVLSEQERVRREIVARGTIGVRDFKLEAEENKGLWEVLRMQVREKMGAGSQVTESVGEEMSDIVEEDEEVSDAAAGTEQMGAADELPQSENGMGDNFGC